MRKSAGGYHAKTRLTCYLCSCLTVFGVIMCTKILLKYNYVIMIWLGMTLIAEFIIYMLAPLGNSNRRLDEEEIRYFKRRTGKIMIIENLLLMICVCGESWKYAIPIMIAVVCEGLLLLLEKLREKM